MTCRVTIIAYHFVRELPLTRYPAIKGLLTSQFVGQLDFLGGHYRFVTMEDCIAAASGAVELPERAALLTFDDGYADHFTNVFPILDERGIQGCFYPPALAITQHEVLAVNKIHFLLAAVPIGSLTDDLFTLMGQFRQEYELQDDAWYVEELAHPGRFDGAEVRLVKRLLQFELDESLRKRILDELFTRHVAEDEAAFARELYMGPEQLRCMIRHGMHVGSHGHDHVWLDKLEPDRQAIDVDRSLEFLSDLGVGDDGWTMCYPYGRYDDSLIDILRARRCALALTTRVDVATLTPEHAFTLPRLDTNDLPKDAGTQPDAWTLKA